MDSSNIKPAQAEQLCHSLRRSLAYLGRLQRRMELLGFPPEDAMYCAVSRAHAAMQDLHVRTHYFVCTSGVGRSGGQGTSEEAAAALRSATACENTA